MDLPFGIWLLFIGLIWVAEAPLPGGRGDSLQLGNPQDHAVVAGNPPEDDEILRINQELIPPEAPESSFLLEGDIIKVSPFRVFSSASPKWPKRRGIVQIPFVLSYKYDKQSVKVIKEAFADFAKFTCIKFVPYSYQRDFISVTPMSGCFSSVGRTGGMQVVSLVPACLRRGKGVALHELMHVVGFWHEHSRADRDKYISISWNEILTGFEINFMKSWTSNMLVTYDYSSVLHYGRYAFSMTGLPTITPLSNPYAALGQRWNLSSSDIARVNKLYKCSRTGADAESPSTIKENIKDFISNEVEPCPTEGETKVSTTSPISRASSPGTNPHETAQSAWRPSKQMSAPTAATEKLMGRTAMNDEELRVSLTPVQGVQSVKFAPTGLSTHGITYLEATGKTPSTHIEMGTAEAEGKHLIPMEETSLLGTVSSQEPDFTTVMLSPESQPSPRKVTSYHGKVAEGLGTTKIPTETLAGLEFPELVSSGVAPVEMGGTRPSETTSVQEMELAYHSTYLAQKGPSPATEIRVVPLTSNQTWSLETPTELAPPEITSSLEVSSGTYMPVMHTVATLALGQTPPMQVSAIETSHLISTEKWTTNFPRLTSAKTTKAPTRARSAPTGQTPSVEMETTTVAYATEKTSLFPITPNWTSSPTKQRIQSVAHQAYTPESQEQNTIAISASGLTKTEPTEAMQPTSLMTFEMAENPTSSPELQFPLFATTKHKKSASLSSLGIETSSIEPPTKVITFMETQTELGFVDATRIKASGQHGFPSLPEGTYFPVSKVKDDEYATETGTLPVTWVSEPAEMSVQTTANYRNQERIHTTTIGPTYTPSLGESENPATHPQNAGPEEATGSKDQSQATLSTRSSTDMGVQEARNTSPKQRRGHTYTLASVLTSSTAPELKFMEHPTRNFHGTSSPLSQAPEVTFPTETSTTNAAEMGVQEAINPLRKRSRWVSHTAHSTEQTSMAAAELTYATFSAEPAQPTIHSGYRETAEVLGTEAGNQLSLSVSTSRMELGAQKFKGVQEAESYKKKGRVYIHTHAPVRERSSVVTEQSSKTVLATKAIKTQTRVRMETHVQEMEGRSTVPTTEGMLPVASETTKAGYPFPEAFGTPTTNVTEVGSGKEAPSSPREGSGGETPIRMPATATEMHSGLSSKVASTPGSLETRTISIPESATGILASLKKAGARTEQTEAVHLPGTEVVHGQFLEAQTKTTLQAVVGLQGAKSHGTQGKGFVPIEGTKATYVMSSLEAAEAPVTNPHSRTANTTDIGASLQDTSYILRSTEMQQEAASNYGKEGGHTFAATPAGTQPVRSESGHLGHPTERTLVQETQSIRSRGGEATETASTQTKAQNLSHTKEGTSIAKTAMEAVHSTRGALLLETPDNQTLKLREVAMKAETSLYGEEEGLTTHLLPSVTLSAETAEQVQSTEVRELILPENWPTGHPELGTSKHTTNKTRTGEEHTSLTSMGKLPSIEANTTKLVYPTEEASLLLASPHQTFSPTEWEIRTTSSQETPAMIFPQEEHGQSPMSPGGMQPTEASELLGLFTQTTSTWSPETPTWRLEEVSVFHRKKGRGKPSPLPTGTAQLAESETSKAFIPNAILVDAMEGQTTSQTVLGITKVSLAQLLGSSRHAERASFPGAEATEAVIKVPSNGTETQTALPNKTRELIPTARTRSVEPEAMGQSYSTTMKAVKTPSSLSERMLYTATSSHRKAWPPFFYTHPPIGSMSSTGSDTSSSLGPSYYQAAPYSTEPMKSWLESRAQSAAGGMVPTSLSLSLKTQTASSPAKGNGGKSHLSSYGGITPVGAWGLRHKTYAPEWHSSQSEKWALHTTTLANGELSTPQAQSRGERTAINSAVGRMPTPGTEEAHSLKAIQLKRAFRKHPGALFAVDPEILHLVGKRSLPDAMASLAPPHDSNPDLKVITLTHGQTGPDLSRSLLSNSWAKQRAKDLEAFPKQHFLLPGFQVSPITALYPAAKVFKSVPWWLRAGISDCTLDRKCGLFRPKKHLLGRKKATNLAPFLTSAKAVQPTAPPGMDKPIAAPLPRQQSGPGKHGHSNQTTPKAMVASALLEWQVCDFEEDLCSWQQSDTDDFDWILAGERPARSLPGGNVSDSPSGGNYISLRSPSARQTPGQKTALISPILHGIGCISFWYSPLGSAMGTINLYIKLAGAPEWHRIWTAEGKQGLEWHQVGMAASESQKLQVMVEGVIGPEAGSDAGIDDLAICVTECQGGCEALLAFYKK